MTMGRALVLKGSGERGACDELSISNTVY